MNTTVWKYCVDYGQFQLDLPIDSEILSLQMQDGRPKLWVFVRPHNRTVTRYFQMLMTGSHNAPISRRYIGTVLDGLLVWHLFETLPPITNSDPFTNKNEFVGWPGDGSGLDDLADYNQNEANDYQNE